MNARPNSNLILAIMRDDFGGGDEWGTALSWAFGVAETLHTVGAGVPDELGFRPSPYLGMADPDEEPEEYPDAEVWRLLRDGDVTIADLQFAGRCLARYIDWLRATGKDY